MKVVVLGATGQTGLQVVDQALSSGHQVTAYVRRSGSLPSSPNLSVVMGQVDDVRAMTAAFEAPTRWSAVWDRPVWETWSADNA